MATLSTIIVTYDSHDAVQRSLPALTAQLREGDELIVVDNASADGTPAVVRELAPDAIVIEGDENLGFAAGGNRGALEGIGELLCFLNPDAVPAAGWRDAIERPLTDGSGWAAWQGLVTSDGGETINSRGGVVHYTGIAWAGGAGEPATAVASAAEGPPFVSGACLAIPRRVFEAVGAFPEPYFLYHEDVDLSLRLRLAGRPLGVVADARVDHDYSFQKGPAKWRYLERNRWATVLRTYPTALLALVAPALLATELALLGVAAAAGWLPQKLAAYADTLRSLPRLLAERREIQARRVAGAADFAEALSADLDSVYLGAAGQSTGLRTVLRAYWSAVRALLGAPRSDPGSAEGPASRSARSS